MGRLLTDTIGRIATLLGFDGTNFSALRVDTTGRLKVRGEDQLISYQGSVADRCVGVPSGAGGYRESASPPAGTIWVITRIAGYDLTTATTIHSYALVRGGLLYNLAMEVGTFAIGYLTSFVGPIYLIPGDTVRCYLTGALVTDTCGVILQGHSMTIAV